MRSIEVTTEGVKTDQEPALWVIVKSNSNLLGFDANMVGNMIAIPKVTKVPDNLEYMSGTITVRGSIIPLIDLRVFTGQPSAHQEIEAFCLLMDQRLIDHQNWINELKASINEGREFRLTADPHMCAFGKWYDNYSTENRILTGILAKFDAPHKRIHGIAERVRKLVDEGNQNDAHALIDTTAENELLTMVKLFSDLKEAAREASLRRIAMVLENENQSLALDIDEVVAVERISKISDAPNHESSTIGISRIGHRDKDGDLVLLMENIEF